MALNELSYCAMHTTFTCAGGAEAIGTSFFYDYDGKTWLVTAAHNVTARHAFTEAELGCPPTDRPVALTLSHCVEEPGEERTRLRIGTCDLPLYDLDGTGRWIHHPHGRHVDIAAMPTSGIPADWKQRTVNDQRLSEVRPFPVTAGESAVILGFPLQGEPRLSFWKAATVATEPDLRNASHFWVDSASRPGMSGGPVFARHSGWLGSDSDPSDGAWGVFYHFIGVYTGRVDDDEFSVQVGRVIRANVINEMLEANTFWTEGSGF